MVEESYRVALGQYRVRPAARLATAPWQTPAADDGNQSGREEMGRRKDRFVVLTRLQHTKRPVTMMLHSASKTGAGSNALGRVPSGSGNFPACKYQSPQHAARMRTISPMERSFQKSVGCRDSADKQDAFVDEDWECLRKKMENEEDAETIWALPSKHTAAMLEPPLNSRTCLRKTRTDCVGGDAGSGLPSCSLFYWQSLLSIG